MLSLEEARAIAENHLKSIPTTGDVGPLALIDHATIEKPYASIFFYNSRRYLDTGDITLALGGNGPLFISRLDGQVTTFPTSLTIDQMIDQFEEREKVWQLELTENIYSDAGKLLRLKTALGLSNQDIANYKRSELLVLDQGSATKLLRIQDLLKRNHINTQIVERNQSQ